MNAKEFLKQLSPNDDVGIRNDLGRLENHIVKIMELYADHKLKNNGGLGDVRGCFTPDEVLEILNDASDLEDAKIMVNEGFANEG